MQFNIYNDVNKKYILFKIIFSNVSRDELIF